MITCSNITLSFHQQALFDSYSEVIHDGEMIAISGPSGVGKSTLLRILAGLQKPDSGTMNHDYKHVGMIFQDYQLFEHLDVFQNITLAPSKKKDSSKEEVHSEAIRLMEQFNISHLQKKSPQQLSGGEKQRVAIVRALMLKPGLLLVDEATSALDKENALAFMETLKQLNKEGMTIVFISHQNELIESYATRVIHL